MKTDKYTKFLLTVIALGLWTMILKPFVGSAPAHAQAGKKYEFLIDNNGKVQIGGSGRISIDDSAKMREGIRLAAAQGWRVHSFGTAVNYNTNYTQVLLEK